ncbi:MAG TPA: DUF5985 family protein [Blastocatellia bacterium]|nr:DUF5985 family protein [Blastocatellia bacterium]
MNQFLQGATFFACLVAALFFLKFWRESGDRLFVFFMVAFVVLGFNWLGLAATKGDEVRTWLYVLRLAGFGLILIAIIDKNRSRRIR